MAFMPYLATLDLLLMPKVNGVYRLYVSFNNPLLYWLHNTVCSKYSLDTFGVMVSMLGASWSIMENMQQPCGFALGYHPYLNHAFKLIALWVAIIAHSKVMHLQPYLPIMQFWISSVFSCLRLRQWPVTYLITLSDWIMSCQPGRHAVVTVCEPDWKHKWAAYKSFDETSSFNNL